MSYDENKVRWIRPLRYHEEYHDITQKMNTFMTVYRLALATPKLLKEEDFLTALRHLQRKVINLRLAIKRRADGVLWFCERHEEKIDFKVIKNANIEEEFEKMSIIPYDSFNGPLWRVQLQHEPNESCYLPELQDKYPHQYTFLIGTHHGTLDGTSKHTILGLFLRILNDVIAGKPVDDEPFGFLSDSAESNELVKLRIEELKQNPELSLKIQKEIAAVSKVENHWGKITNNHKDPNPRNLHIIRILEPEVNKKLYQKFKSIGGVSFHSGFSSFINVALIDMMKVRGINQSEYEIGTFHAVNCRRYWKSKDKKLAFGNNYGAIRVPILTDSNVKSNLESYMKVFHSKLVENINNKRNIDEDLFYKLKDESGKEVSVEEFLCNPTAPYVYYLNSNMTDVTSLIGTGGEHVQLTWFTRSTSIQNMNYPLLFMMHSFRDRLIIGLDCNTRYIPKSVAEELVDRTLDLCREWVK